VLFQQLRKLIEDGAAPARELRRRHAFVLDDASDESPKAMTARDGPRDYFAVPDDGAHIRLGDREIDDDNERSFLDRLNRQRRVSVTICTGTQILQPVDQLTARKQALVKIMARASSSLNT